MKIYIIAIISLLLLSCNSDKNSIVGNWQIISLQSDRGNELKEGDYSYTYAFRKDGTYESHFQGDTTQGQWVLDSKNKTIVFDEGFKVIKGFYKLNSKMLSLEVKKYIGKREDASFGTIFIKLEKLQ
ncbi:lipocalin family protein [Cellulophaga sp. Z1A5H]|uniref:lipocalin family protein n=1 Tax=Cellulophaga sp. Z1A5H TaxID=2687291 RepID=UPI0013FD74EA|nr:lipocalin family protein [Cellulophaga sp. Z1A5H]